MSDSIGPSGPKAGSTFDRLKAGAIRRDAKRGEGEVPAARIFNEVSARASIGGLQAAIKTNKEAAQSLESVAASSADVASVNVAATDGATLRNVNEAAALAEKIARAVRDNPKQFEAAHNNLDGANAKALVSNDDPSPA